MSTADRFGLPLGTCRRCLGPLDENADCHACERCPRCKGEGDLAWKEDGWPVYGDCPRCKGDGWVSINGNPKREV